MKEKSRYIVTIDAIKSASDADDLLNLVHKAAQDFNTIMDYHATKVALESCYYRSLVSEFEIRRLEILNEKLNDGRGKK